jgi:uncharacterized protein YqeY
MTGNAGEATKLRLRADLKTAMKERRSDEVSVLRVLIAALDNAEAPATQGRAMSIEEMGGLGSTETDRLTLSPDRVRSILMAEVAEREAAATEMDRAGRGDLAEASRAEVAVIRRYLDQ